MNAPAPQPAPFLKAAGLMLLSTLFFGLMAVVIRVATNAGIATAEIAFFRNAFGLLALLPFLMRPGHASIRTTQLPRYFVRSAIACAIGRWPMAQKPHSIEATPIAQRST